MTGELAGTVAIVTGASRGIGKGIALELGAAGATVYVTARSTSEADHPLPGTVGATAQEIDAIGADAGGKGIAVALDHRDDAAVESLFDRVLAEHGHLDVLVNNAFIVTDQLTSGLPFWEADISNWDDSLDVGTRSAYVASVFAARPMVSTRGRSRTASGSARSTASPPTPPTSCRGTGPRACRSCRCGPGSCAPSGSTWARRWACCPTRST